MKVRKVLHFTFEINYIFSKSQNIILKGELT